MGEGKPCYKRAKKKRPVLDVYRGFQRHTMNLQSWRGSKLEGERHSKEKKGGKWS